MNKKRRRITLYFFLYGFSCLLAIAGLIYNIKSVALNEKIQSLKKEIYTIKRENQKLHPEVLAQSQLKRLDEIATQKLKMNPPDAVHYIFVPDHD